MKPESRVYALPASPGVKSISLRLWRKFKDFSHPAICCVFTVLVAVGIWTAGAGRARAGDAYKVLVLHSYNKGYCWTDNIMEGIRSVFDKSGLDVEMYVEYMDTKRSEPESVFPLLEELYREKYQSRRFDAVILSDDNALNFLLERREGLFPGVPVVFCGVNSLEGPLVAGQKDITGVMEDYDLEGTIDLILKAQPEIRHIAVITDVVPTGKLHLQNFHRTAPQFKEKVAFIELGELTAPELSEALGKLPRDTALLNLSFYRDRTGATFTIKESMAFLKKSGLPVYSCWDAYLEAGITGGVITSGYAHGARAAQMALRIFSGEPAGSIPILRKSPNRPMFNYDQMERFGISMARLPEETIVLNEPESLYYRYKMLIWVTVVFIFLQALAIAALVGNINRRRRAQINLEKAMADLGRSNRELEQFAYVASHDLQEPLRKVLSFSDRIRAKYADILDEQGRDYLERTEKAVIRMRSMIQDLLTLSRITTKAQPFSWVSLTDVAHEAVSDLEVRIRRTDARVRIEDLPVIEADPLQMAQLMLNLVSNALKFHREGVPPEVSLRGHIINDPGVPGDAARNPEPAEAAGRAFCRIFVQDNGTGFDEKHLERIFQPFQRLHGMDKHEGTGIGLTICLKIVERHCGEITAQSTPGKGSTFIVTLPVRQTSCRR